MRVLTSEEFLAHRYMCLLKSALSVSTMAFRTGTGYVTGIHPTAILLLLSALRDNLRGRATLELIALRGIVKLIDCSLFLAYPVNTLTHNM